MFYSLRKRRFRLITTADLNPELFVFPVFLNVLVRAPQSAELQDFSLRKLHFGRLRRVYY